ncbi:hypothetical protein C9374_006910 [Naegleria lovaniensis]|uniref:Large ribosomal subunit protein uL23 N-terminal domain-containing protein n=2 Tax=Naegleria TaxID=5761 RepID=A0AA88H4D0_NAELO|nr:uncharacterized protein C9374_006910 [Naegleria lovaniensis]XP_044568733.1 uncharacterized protein FDP41_007935 [Naegleria fowleri]KAF0984020.1 hypothetical protein FDP41_007935 [Naegleria fowleri]KAG2393379.1 hypothetical protein C9374_006910 [Naegleria lovaniensis]CAG4717682.1 unnamed protein product [Naegleria fowleri]
MPAKATKTQVKKEIAEPKTSQQVEKKREQAKKNLSKITKRGKGVRSHKVWTSVTFRRPKTLRLAKKPKYVRKSIAGTNDLDTYQILQYPPTLQNPKVSKAIEDNNTIAFVVDLKANKKNIKKAFEELCKTKVQSVRTQITAKGRKLALIKLPSSVEAVDIATQIGLC